MLTQRILNDCIPIENVSRMTRAMIYRPYPVIGGIGILSGLSLGAIVTEKELIQKEGQMDILQYMDSITLTHSIEQLVAHPVLPMYSKLLVYLAYYEWVRRL